jgi:hypothetical protein
MEISRLPMPGAIRERDYQTGQQLKGGWLDLQEVLRGILYQGGLALNPEQRLAAIETKARSLLQEDPDDSLFNLFQALDDSSLGYSATHALLCAAVCELAGQKLGLDELQRRVLMGAALTMNIGMAREQDVLARQNSAPSEVQRHLIQNHPQISVDILRKFGIDEAEELDIVRWHHQPDAPEGLAHTLQSRRLLHMTDVFVAMMAARRTREAISPLESAKSIYLKTERDVTASVGGALTAAIGFFPPGTYVHLANGDIAVAVQRGVRANTPWVVSILGKDGMPATRYVCLDTADPAHAIAAPLAFRQKRVAINVERVRRARERIPRSAG